jgi:hypothetical protein
MQIYVKPILPGALNLKEVQAELLQACHQESFRLQNELKRTVQSWKDKPAIGKQSGSTAQAAYAWSGPEGDNQLVRRWVWLDEGTRPHFIRARRVSRLRFRTGYRAKTRPGWLGSGPGGANGPWRAPKRVRHRGTAPRRWSRTLAIKEQPFFDKRVQSAVERGMEKAWKKGQK